MPTPSYSHGTSDTPLLGDTIGVNFARTAARFADRPALVSRHQDVRLTYAQLDAAIDAAARAAFCALGIERGRPRRHLGAQLRRVGARPVRDGEGRRDPRQHQPGLPHARARVRAAPVGRAAADQRQRVQDQRLRGDDRRGVRRHPMRSSAPSSSTARSGTQLVAPATPDRRGDRRADGDAVLRRPDQHPVHERHDGLPQGRDALAPQHPQQRLSSSAELMRATPSATASACRCPSTTASAWSWATSGTLATARCIVIPAPAFEPGATLEAVAAERCTSLYGVPTMFIASSGIDDFDSFDLTSLRTGIMAGSPCPVEVMKQVVDRMHMTRGGHLLRHDGDLARSPPRRAPTTRSSGGWRRSGASARTSRSRSSTRETGLVVAARRAGRAVHARLLRDARLLGGRGADRGGDRPRRLDAHRRPRDDGRRGLPATSSGASRTWSSAAARTSTRARSRSSSTRHAGIADVQVVGVPDEKYGEELLRVGPAPRRRRARRGRHPRLLPRAPRALQGAALRDLRRRVPDDDHRQGPEVQDARGVGRAARAPGRSGGAQRVAVRAAAQRVALGEQSDRQSSG